MINVNVSSSKPLALTGFLVLAFVLAIIGSQIQKSAVVDAAQLPSSLLLQIRNDQNLAVHTIGIFQASPTWQVLPPKLSLSTGTTRTTLSESASGLNLNNSRNWLRGTYDVNFAETWVIDRVGLSALVDLVGGVEVVPDVDLMLKLNGRPVFYLSKNQSVRLEGIAASLYATSSSVRPGRFIQVWKGVMQKLDAAYLESVLPSVGNSSRSTLGLAELIRWIETTQAQWANSTISWESAETELQLQSNQYRVIFNKPALAKLRELGKGDSIS